MLDSVLSLSSAGLTVPEFIFCTVFSIMFGVVIALVHMYRNQYSKNFILTLILLPAIVQTVIMLVNGNLGTGVAVAGAFSLVRFRSVPGNSREIASIFFGDGRWFGYRNGVCGHRRAAGDHCGNGYASGSKSSGRTDESDDAGFESDHS